jgi:uncharacterized protein
MSERYAWADHRIFAGAGASALLFAADDASLFAIDDCARDVIARWSGRETIALADAPADDRDVLAALRDARVLVPIGERATVPSLDPAAIPLGTLVLEAAQACNLRCTYCYAGGGAYGGEARLMAPALAARAARFLVEASGDRPSVTLVLFGGEPMLNLPALEAAVREGEAAAAALGKKLVVSMTTNGTRFTDEALDFLAAHRIGVSVSIDGPPDVHDANRRYAGARGGGTHADVVAGVARLAMRTGRRPAARVTLTPEQWHRVPEVFAHVLELGFLEVGIAPASPTRAGLLPTAAQQSALIDGFGALAERFTAEAERGRVLPFSNLLDLLARLHDGNVKAAPCGAGLGYLAIDAQGRFYVCHRLAGVQRFEAGDLDAGVDHAKVHACLADEAAARRDACAACWARALCAGGCHYENHVRERDLGLAHGGSCDFIRRWLEIGIRAYGRLDAAPGVAMHALLERRLDD